MLVNGDVKGLEVVVAAQLSGDRVLRQEIIDKEDIHANNQKAFNLGEGKAGRLIAKIFKFRLIYGGSAYSYANDPAFMDCSRSEQFWQGVIDAYYAKYSGIAEWHQWLEYEAKTTGRLTIPSGRYYPFAYEQTKWGLKWPSTKVKNYPVQGFGADLVKLARLEFSKRLRQSEYLDRALLISTIHDSIVVDCPASNQKIDNIDVNVYNIGKMLKESVEAVPKLCEQLWDYEFTLPLSAEISAGMNKRDMKEIFFND